MLKEYKPKKGLSQVMDEIQNGFFEAYGRHFTEEEANAFVEEAIKEVREKNKTNEK